MRHIKNLERFPTHLNLSRAAGPKLVIIGGRLDGRLHHDELRAWLFPGERRQFAFRGYEGQYVFVDPILPQNRRRQSYDLYLRYGWPKFDRSRSRHSAGMRVMSVVRCGLLSFMIMVSLMGGPALTEDLEQGKSGAKLFAANCAHCHRSARGLAKDKSSWTLSHFLQQHYTSSSTSAEALTAFLQSVDARATSQPSAGKSLAPNTSTSGPVLRPPAPVPAR